MPVGKTELLTSARNPLLKEIRRGVARGGLTEDGYCIAETFHLLEEALRSDCELGPVLAAESARSAIERRSPELGRARVVVLPDELFAQVSSTESSQGVMVLVRPPAWTLDDLFKGQSLVIVLDGLQDPGNAGAIIRAAEAFGATGVMFLKGAANPYNPKCVRASAGSLFRVPLVYGVDPARACAVLEQRGVELWAAMPDAPRTVADADLTRRCAIVIGSEGRGVSPALRDLATNVRIATTGVESLNAAMAAGVLLYEAARQRTGR